MIKKLKLTNFRQFKNLDLEFTTNLVVIVGDNTRGKSSILEAIHILTTGETPLGNLLDINKNEQEELNPYFRIEALIQNDKETNTYSYFKDRTKRQLRINNENRSSKKYYEKISSILFSPEQIEILMISPSRRRDFIDSLILQTDFEFRDLNSKFKKVLRQRNSYLKKLSKIFYESGLIHENDSQLKYWTNLFATYSSQIIKKRAEIINHLKTETFHLQYTSTLDLNNFEEMIDLQNLEERHLTILNNNVKADIALGYTRKGAHRDDWKIFNGKDIKRFGSRGEKRMAIIQLVFYTQDFILKKMNVRPYLLLDDIPSELDKNNIKNIFSKNNLNKQQTFITAISISDIPQIIKKESQIINLNEI